MLSVLDGHVRCSSLHKVNDYDPSLGCHLRKAPALNYSVLHPGNNKQSVSVALAIFDSKTTTALRQYLKGDDSVTPAFLELVNAWWLIVNAKERYHPNPIGNAIDSNTCDKKIAFLQGINEWLTTWKQSEALGFSKQTFNDMITTNNAIILGVHSNPLEQLVRYKRCRCVCLRIHYPFSP